LPSCISLQDPLGCTLFPSFFSAKRWEVVNTNIIIQFLIEKWQYKYTAHIPVMSQVDHLDLHSELSENHRVLEALLIAGTVTDSEL